MRFILPDYVIFVLDRFKKYNKEAYVVGGAVRDFIIGREINDYDIATNAEPYEVRQIFNDCKIIDIGEKFGSLMLVISEKTIEVTTYRKDGSYIDGRRPEEVNFTTSLKEDLKRRDFTINSLAYRNNKIIDYFGGQKDIYNKLIKTVGNPFDRFSEDYLRVLRAVRFASQLNFTIEEDTYEACKIYGRNLSKVSNERIRDEFFKILLSDRPSYGIELLRKLNILDIIIPELSKTIGFNQYNPNHIYDIYIHTLKALDEVPNKIEVRLATLFHDLGKVNTFSMDSSGIGHFYGHNSESAKISVRILKRWNTNKTIIKRVKLLVEKHMVDLKTFKTKGLKRLIRDLGNEGIGDLIELQIADRKASNKKDISDILKKQREIEVLIKNGFTKSEKQLAISGKHVIELGYKEGKIIGEILSYLLDQVMENEELNNENDLKRLIKEKYR